jgi:hypothetical protein
MNGRTGSLVGAIWMATAGIAGIAVAEQRSVVVELYTSQGCSTCPPADAMLGELAGMPGVIALGLHVDYWDYIGWEDTFGREAFTARQEKYASVADGRGIYTPQFIVGGVDSVVGANAMEIMALVSRHASHGTGVTLDVSRDGDRLRIEGRTEAPPLRPMSVEIVRYRPSETVEIGGGENAGSRIAYSNIVTDWEKVADWPGTTPLTLELDAPGEGPVVVLLQEPGPGRIVAAAVVD